MRPVPAVESPGMDTFFLVCAALGGGLFVVRLILQFTLGAGHDGDLHHLPVSEHHDASDSDSSFKAWSLQGITAFVMMFGLVGHAVLDQKPACTGWALAGALLAGLVSVWVVARIFSLMGRLEASGTMDLAKAVGQTGTVYLTIPSSGMGQVQVPVQGSLRTLDAQAKQELKTGDLIKVTGVVDGSVLMVEKA